MLSKDTDHPAHPRSLISLCYLGEEAVYLTERVVKTNRTADAKANLNLY